MYQCLVVPYVNPANNIPVVQIASPQWSLAPMDKSLENIENLLLSHEANNSGER